MLWLGSILLPRLRNPDAEFFYAIYWYRIINETSTALALTITFPADSFPMSPSEDSYLKVFLPPDTMTLAKEGLHNYGATELNSFLDRGVHKSTGLEKTINPKEACLFYIGGLLHNTSLPARAELFLKGQDLFYRIGGMEIPCGHIDIKN